MLITCLKFRKQLRDVAEPDPPSGSSGVKIREKSSSWGPCCELNTSTNALLCVPLAKQRNSALSAHVGFYSFHTTYCVLIIRRAPGNRPNASSLWLSPCNNSGPWVFPSPWRGGCQVLYEVRVHRPSEVSQELNPYLMAPKYQTT